MFALAWTFLKTGCTVHRPVIVCLRHRISPYFKVTLSVSLIREDRHFRKHEVYLLYFLKHTLSTLFFTPDPEVHARFLPTIGEHEVRLAVLRRHCPTLLVSVTFSPQGTGGRLAHRDIWHHRGSEKSSSACCFWFGPSSISLLLP
mgnify:CR=1 FL=1